MNLKTIIFLIGLPSLLFSCDDRKDLIEKIAQKDKLMKELKFENSKLTDEVKTMKSKSESINSRIAI